MYDIISIGDTTVDDFLDIDDATVLCDLDKNNCRICFDYADKIPIKGVTTVKAVGNAANHAVGMARLGKHTGLYTILGNDDTGKDMYHHLVDMEKVSDEYIQFDEHRGSNHSTVLNYKGERTILVFHEDREYVMPEFAQTKWYYLTSMGEGHEAFLDTFVAHVKKTKEKVAFNPGSFQLNMGAEKLSHVLSVTDILFVNRHEAMRLVDGSDEIPLLMKALHEYGCKNVVITDGPDGSYVSDGKQIWFLDILDAPVVERTGCGDAYATAFLAAVMDGNSADKAMCWGNVSSTAVLQHIGAQKGLLTKEEMDKRLQETNSCQPSTFE